MLVDVSKYELNNRVGGLHVDAGGVVAVSPGHGEHRSRAHHRVENSQRLFSG
jgi:hypothetical protein